MTKVIVVAGQKGGVGKTTIAVNLAAVLAEARGGTPDDSPVAVISVDPQASTVWWAQRVGDELPFDFDQAHDQPNKVAKLKSTGRYEYLIVDTPGSLQDEQNLTTVLDVADEVLLPMIPEPLCFDPTARTVEQVVKPRGLPFRAVINAWDPRDGESDLQDLKAFIERKGWPRARSRVRRYKLHTRASVQGTTVVQYNKQRVGMECRQDFYQLALEVSLAPGSDVNDVYADEGVS